MAQNITDFCFDTVKKFQSFQILSNDKKNTYDFVSGLIALISEKHNLKKLYIYTTINNSFQNCAKVITERLPNKDSLDIEHIKYFQNFTNKINTGTLFGKNESILLLLSDIDVSVTINSQKTKNSCLNTTIIKMTNYYTPSNFTNISHDYKIIVKCTSVYSANSFCKNLYENKSYDKSKISSIIKKVQKKSIVIIYDPNTTIYYTMDFNLQKEINTINNFTDDFEENIEEDFDSIINPTDINEKIVVPNMLIEI
ncbi:putative ORFan [Cotonvirus japonicus]|uniref:ORFan n=1 Tax=Cotonvirus japonicus TaxID=2811091 RepID=A0ABM7NRM7_9VIRU|nr:putative ORFan [Cotonvirus japonicus]BCS82818.1 putative ORFan [Cotonvirus japonicus]